MDKKGKHVLGLQDLVKRRDVFIVENICDCNLIKQYHDSTCLVVKENTHIKDHLKKLISLEHVALASFFILI